jgi:hypothetical protein
MIIGCDCYPSWQQIAWFDRETGRPGETETGAASGDAKVFYRKVAAPARIGMDATGTNRRRSRCSRLRVRRRGSGFHHQFQNMGCIQFECLLLAHTTGLDLRRIPDPDLMPRVLDQFDEPLTVVSRQT